MSTIRNIYDESHWVEANGYPEGTKMKTLRDEEGAKTVLLKIPKGFHMESHTHVCNEQHLILDGEYEIEGQAYSSGTYRFIESHKDHGPFTSKTGAMILVVWDKIN